MDQIRCAICLEWVDYDPTGMRPVHQNKMKGIVCTTSGVEEKVLMDVLRQAMLDVTGEDIYEQR